jgi:predicted amidophosphoribosyltransferase
VSASTPYAATALDDEARTDHPYLSQSDECWCLAQYVAGPGYLAGCVNQLISNLKCRTSVAAANPLRRRHKEHAIEVIACALRSAVGRSWAESATWVPIPPSRALSDPDYDDRLARVLTRAFAGCDLDLRLLLHQSGSTASDHISTTRISCASLYERIHVNAEAIRARPLRERLVLFDDVLTTGKHYKCCERRLRGALPHIPIIGLFLARRVVSGRGRRVP